MPRPLTVIALVLLCIPAAAQQPTAPELAQAQLPSALVGDWTGVLEYRDYSEPAGSTRRVELPTWLSIDSSPQGLRLTYTYDDGPNKLLTETSLLVIDSAAATYKVLKDGVVKESYSITGLDQLKDGRGRLTLAGTGIDNNKPAERRITLTIRRNLLEWIEEARPEKSAEPFAFRHVYRLTRAQPPAAGSAAKP